MQEQGRRIGVNFNKDKTALIRIWAPEAKELILKTETFSLSLKLSGDGYWIGSTDQLRAGEAYWLVLNGQQWPDPSALAQVEGVHGPSTLVDLDFQWTDHNWSNPSLEEYIIYELHTGTFSDKGDFKNIGKRLDHLLDLGITAIELMPIGSFPGTRNWGYDGVFPFAVQESYGGAKALQELINLCHGKGLAVILDVVYNHFGPEGNYLGHFGPFFTDKYQTPWGQAINFDDADCDGVRDFVVENAIMWFRDFHVDALRLDAVHAIRDLSAWHILQEISTQRDELVKHTGRKHYLIAECDLNDPKYIDAIDKNGLGMDAQWTDEFHHALRVSAGEPRKGYYSDFSSITQLAKSFKDAYVYTGEYSKERKKRFGRSAAGHPGKQFIVFSQNHDQVGNRMLGERSSMLYSFEMQKLLAAAVLLSPFVPMLFMGEEWAANSPFLYFVSHGEEKLIAQVRAGRKAEFAAMHADGETPDPQSEDTFQRSKLNWQELNQAGHQTMLAWYKRLIKLRKQESLLGLSGLNTLHSHAFENQQCLMIERGRRGSKSLICCFFNFSDQVQHLAIPGHLSIIQKIIDSTELQDNSTDVLQPESFIAYSASYV